MTNGMVVEKAGSGSKRSLRRAVMRILPAGRGLADEGWRGRHAVIVVLAWAHAAAVPLYGYVTGRRLSDAALEAAPIALFSAVASLPAIPRRIRAAAASAALLTSSAILVHFSGGLIEMHFHFFVMVAVVAIYQDWAPFLLAIAYVLVHHGVVGQLAPGSVFNHPSGQADPWRWAGVHALFITGISIACLATWRVNEIVLARQRRAETDLMDEKRMVETLHSIGSGIVSELDIDRVSQLVTDEAVKATGAAFGAFFYNVYDSAGESFMLYTLSGVPREAFASFPMPRNTKIFAPTFAGTGVVRSDDIVQDERYGHNAPYHGMPAGHLPVRSYLAVPVRSRGSSEVLGGLFFGHPSTGVFTEREERVAVGIATQAAIAFDNARLYQAEREAHQIAEVAGGRLTLLADAGRVLATSLDPEATLRDFASVTVPTLADICVVDLVVGDEIRRVDAFAAPGLQGFADGLKRFAPDPSNEDHPVVRVINGGAPEVIEFVTPGLIESATKGSEHADTVRRMHETSSVVVPLLGRGAVLGAVSFLTVASSERMFGPEDIPLAEELGRRAGMAVENARLYQAEREARVEADRATTSLSLLAEAGRLSATPLDEEVRMQQLAALTVPTLADACLIDLVEDDGTIRRVAAATKGLESFADALGMFPPDPDDADHPIVKVMHGHPTILVEEIDDDFLDRVARIEPHRTAAAAAKVGSTVIVSLAARGGIYGSLALINLASSGRRFGPGDIPLAEEIGRRAGVAVHNARMYRTERQALEDAEDAGARLSLLADASRILASSLEIDTTLQGVAALTVPTFADASAIDLLEESGSLRRVSTAAVPGVTDVPDVPGDAMGRVLQGKGSQLIEPGAGQPTGAVTSLLVPMLARDRLLGVLSLFTTTQSGRSLDHADVSFAEELGRRAGVAIEIAQLFNQQRTVAESLQHALLPQELPSIPGFVAAARYLPGSPGEHVGGDWYDLFEIPSGEIAVVMGDVVGHGISAASAMAQLRNALRAYVWDGVTPADVLSRLNQLLYGLEREGMATLSLGILDPITSNMRFATAGHPPLLHVAEGGGSEFVGEGLGPPLGAVPFARFREVVIRLDPEESLIFYTDGLVEDRRTSLDVGLQCLRAATTNGVEDIEKLADHVLEVCLGDRTVDDDVALLVLRALPIDDHLTMRLPAEPRVLGQLRQTMRRWLRQNDVSDDDALDVLIACGEACNNAIEHGRATLDGCFEVDAKIDGDITIVVRNEGTWRVARKDGGGRGIPVMKGLMDDVHIDHTSDGVEIRLRRRMAASKVRS